MTTPRSPASDTPLPWPDRVDHLRLHANGLTFYAAACGPEDGPLVLLLHGFPEFSWAWRRQLGTLARAGLRVVAPDLRGYGLSDKPAEVAAYRVEHLADDVLGMADALGHRTFRLAGHDWGGVVGWHLLRHHPGRIERAVILDAPHPGTFLPYLLRNPTQALRSSYMAAFQLPWLPERLLAAGDGDGLARALVRSSRPGTFTDDDLAVYREAWRQPGALRAMLNWYRAPLTGSSSPTPTPTSSSTDADAPEADPSAPRPRVRILWGEGDQALEPALADAAGEAWPGAEVVHVPDTTHWLHHEAPAEVARHLVEVLG